MNRMQSQHHSLQWQTFHQEGALMLPLQNPYQQYYDLSVNKSCLLIWSSTSQSWNCLGNSINVWKPPSLHTISSFAALIMSAVRCLKWKWLVNIGNSNLQLLRLLLNTQYLHVSSHGLKSVNGIIRMTAGELWASLVTCCMNPPNLDDCQQTGIAGAGCHNRLTFKMKGKRKVFVMDLKLW